LGTTGRGIHYKIADFSPGNERQGTDGNTPVAAGNRRAGFKYATATFTDNGSQMLRHRAQVR